MIFFSLLFTLVIFHRCLHVMDSITFDAVRLKSFLMGSAWIWDGSTVSLAGYWDDCNSARGKYSLGFLCNSVCLQEFPLLGSWRKRALCPHLGSSAGVYPQTKLVCWNEKRSLGAKVLGQSTSDCLNCFTKHLVSTSNSQETFSFRWCFFFLYWVIFFQYISVCISSCL